MNPSGGPPPGFGQQPPFHQQQPGPSGYYPQQQASQGGPPGHPQGHQPPQGHHGPPGPQAPQGPQQGPQGPQGPQPMIQGNGMRRIPTPYVQLQLPVPGMDTASRVAAWGEGGGWGLMPDSGISTATPSVMSGASSLAQGLCHSSGPPSHASYEGYGPAPTLQQQFPHLYSDPSATDPDPSPAIPELTAILRDEDAEVASGAATILSTLAKRPSSLNVLVQHPELVRAVVEMGHRWMGRQEPHPRKMVHATIRIVYEMSQHPNGLVALAKTAILPCLVLGIRHSRTAESERTVLYHSVPTLHNLLQHKDAVGGPEIKALFERILAEARTCGMIEALAETLAEAEGKYLAIAADVCRLLIFNDDPAKARFLACGGTRRLVGILSTQAYEKALYVVFKSLKALSVHGPNKDEIIAAGGISAMVPHLRHPSSRLIACALVTLRNLSDRATQTLHADLVDAVANLLGMNEPESVSFCLGILSNISCNAGTKAYMVERERPVITDVLNVLAHNLHILSSCLNKAPGAPAEPPKVLYEILENAVLTVKHLCARHDQEAKARLLLRDYVCPSSQGANGISILVYLVQLAHPTLLPSAMQTLRALGRDPEMASALHSVGAVQAVSKVLQDTYMKYFHHLSNPSPDPSAQQQAVRPLESRMEECLRCLAGLAAESGVLLESVYKEDKDYLVNLLRLPPEASRTLYRAVLSLVSRLVTAARREDFFSACDEGNAQATRAVLHQIATSSHLDDPARGAYGSKSAREILEALEARPAASFEDSDPLADVFSHPDSFDPANSPMDM